MLPGFKYNMMDIQAALGLHQLAKLDSFIASRTRIADFYNAAFADVHELALPRFAPYEQRHAWHIYTPLVRTRTLTIDRDGFMAELKKHNIGTGHPLQGHPPPRLVPRHLPRSGRRTAQRRLRLRTHPVPAAFSRG